MEKSLNKERNYGIDLLRIISMYMVVVLHMIGGDEILEYYSLCSLEYEMAWLLELIAFPAVNCYALISGYVSQNGKSRNANLGILWLQVLIYSVLITFFLSLFFEEIRSWRIILSSFFPVLSNQYWYFTAYVGLFFLMPAWHILIEKMSRKEMSRLLIVGFMLLSVLPMIVNEDLYGTFDGYSMLWLCYLFLVGAFLRKYEVFVEVKMSALCMVYVGCIIMTLGAKFVIEYVSWNYLKRLMLCSFLTKYTAPLIFIQAIMLLLIFSRIHLTEMKKKLVSIFVPCSFGVYLIHNHELMRRYVIVPLRKVIFQNSIWTAIGSVIASAFIIFVLCIAIDYVRLRLFEKFKLRQRMVEWLNNMQ